MTPRTPKLSIVVPVLNEAAGIAATLQALAPLRARGVEVIVVDGGSDDDTAAHARPNVDQFLVAARGRAMQMNAGAAAATGETLLFLHADTRLPETADDAIAAARARGARWGRFQVRIDGRHPLLPMVAWFMNQRSRITGIATGDQAIFVDRALFVAVGGFREQALMEDVELSARLRRCHRPACLAETATTSGRRWDEKGFVRTVLLMWRLRLAYWLGADPSRLARRYGYAPPETPARRTRHRAPRHNLALLVFARAPVPGEAKTRLIPLLGADGAARLAEQLLQRTMATAAEARFGTLQLWCAPDTAHPAFAASAALHGASLHQQHGADLGERMQRALAEALRSHHGAVLIGTDCPELTVDDLHWAAKRIAGPRDLAVVPAEDGGYVLIAMTRPNPTLFAGLRWGEPTVMAETEARAAAAGLTLHRSAPRRDLDTPADLERLRRAGIDLPVSGDRRSPVCAGSD